MRSRHWQPPALACGLVLLASTAAAEPLEIGAIYDLSRYLQCNEACGPASAAPTYEEQRDFFECVAACGAPDWRWEKNGVPPVDRVDLDLALLETMSASDVNEDLVCYRGSNDDIVVPGALCAGDICGRMPTCDDECNLSDEAQLECTEDEPGGPRCWWPEARRPPACPDIVCGAQPNRSPEDCADADGDGVPAWLEVALGSSDFAAMSLCGGSDTCAFDELCVYDSALGSGECALRSCDPSCTAFHLELVAEDDRELLVWVHYDYSPIPARVLDLNLVFDRDALILADARPLPALTAFDKQLASSSLSDGTLRLSVYDLESAWPIPFGAIVELVFQRVSDDVTTIAFDTDDIAQLESIAPLQGNVGRQSSLSDDALWGEPLHIRESDDADTVLRFWLDYEDLGSPIGYANVPDAEALCARLSVCANESDEAERAKLLARLDALQRGELSPADRILGVAGDAAYLDGAFDHLRMPVHYDEPLDAHQQSFSFSSWFYTEGNSGDEIKSSEQVLFTHNAFNERTVFGFKLDGVTDGSMQLVFFHGDLLSKSPPPAEVVVAAALPVRQWHHLGFTFDAPSGQLDIYLDGSRSAFYAFEQPPAVVQCPQFADNTDVLLHDEGDVLGGKGPEFLYTSVRRSNLYKIERMDLHGLASQQVIGDGEFSYRDADYSPILDRLVYSSNASGNFEIWIARGDGTGRQRITDGFGDSARGIFARRPKWAPDGSAIVFESNVFDVLAADNSFRRVYHLYYIEYDRRENVVAIALESGAVVEVLDYAERVADQTIEGFRLTSLSLDRNHTQAQWLRGSYTDVAGSKWRGELLMDTSGPRLEGHAVMRVRIPDNIYATAFEPVPNLAPAGQEVRLITAHRSVRVAVPENIVTERLFYVRSFATYKSEAQFVLTVRELPATDPTDPVDFGGYEVTVTHAPSGYAAQCWDRNLNGLRDTDEDRSRDSNWDVTDCYPFEVRNLYVEYDDGLLSPLIMDEEGNYVRAGALLAPVSAGGTNKELQLRSFYPEGRSLLRVEVLSQTNSTPLPPGEIAVLQFQRKLPSDGSAAQFATVARLANDEYMLKDLDKNNAPWLLALGGMVESIEQATFSPTGDRLLLGGIVKARPVLLITDNLLTVSGAERISPLPMAVRGLNWVREERYYACNWFGGYLHPQNKMILRGFRGGLDDTKVYSGVRDPDAFRSEAERGLERLRAEGRDNVASRLPSCGNSHLECPPYHLCLDSECVMVSCDPTDPYACTPYGGRCTLRPTSVEQEHSGPGGTSGLFDFVCASDCGVDRQCFSQTCLNGPCRFCETESQVCIECREAITQLGALQLAGIEGCPDRRSFACEAGACVTECYAFDDGQSQYLCDSTTEYCDRGRCVLLDWDWWDFAPATLLGLGEMRRVLPPNQFNGYTQAVDQSIPIEIQAYGVADYLTAPDVVVEVRGGPFYGENWARIGRITVYNKTRAEAQLRPYLLSSPATFTDMRLRSVTDPVTNIGRAATGLGIYDEQFCIEEHRRIAAETGQPFDASVCYRKAQGSGYVLGYPLGLPIHEGIEACREHKRPGCPSVAPDEHDFLSGGNPAVVVLEAKVDRGSVMNAITGNRVCSYEGGLVPVDAGTAKKVFYGDVNTEISNASVAFCAQSPELCAGATGLVEFDPALRGFALLNCNLFDPNGYSAGVEFQGITTVQEWPARAGPIVLDDGDTCTVEIDAARVAPCYEWMGGDVGADPATMLGIALNGSLELSLFRSFGHDEGFTSVPLPTWPLRVRVLNYPGGGLTVANGTDVIQVTTIGNDQTLTFATPVKEGRRFDVQVTAQPSNGNVTCLLAPGQGRGVMAEGGTMVTVTCSRVFSIGGLVSGLAGGATATLSKAVTFAGATATEQLTVVIGGFEFAGLVPQGASYVVGVARQPYGHRCTVANASGTVADADVTNIYVNCVEVPFFDLGVTVSGLTGSGLQVMERQTGAVVSPSANGAWVFPMQVAEGSAYELVVTKQPGNPAQACSFTTSQSGVMPRENHLRNYLVCTNVPTYAVRGRVLGMRGRGLRLTLNNGETITLNTPNPLPPELLFAFSTRLFSGDLYAVAIAANPTDPAEICQVATPAGVIGTSDVDVTVACQSAATFDGYIIGGTVSGLAAPQQAGTGLRLALNGGTQTLLVADNGSFGFEQPVGADSGYEVTIDRQPTAPAQNCRVANGKGTVSTSDITSVQVICEPGGTVELQLTLPTSEGAAVRALLFSSRKLVAEAPGAVAIEDGAAVVTMAAVGSSATAVLPPANYVLYLFINQNGSVDDNSGKPSWDIYDLGLSRTIAVTAGQKKTVAVSSSNLTPLVAAAVIGYTTGVPADSVLSCYWGPEGAGPIPLPVGQTSPVAAMSVRACQDGQNCWPGGISFTDRNGVLPAGSHDVTCWVDANETRGVDSGDYLGTTFSVDLPSGSTWVFLSRQ